MKYLNDVNYKDCVGKVFKSNLSGDFKIVKYNDTTNVEIEFLKTGYETAVRLGDIKNGKVKDPYSSSVYGVGILGTKYPSRECDRNTKEYTLWRNMLRRCYSDDFKKKNPTYIDCEVSNKFKNYEYFYEWCHKQIGFGNEGGENPFHLDKDLLIKGNKVYSEDTCVFIPREINQLLTKSTASRGENLIGVTLEKSSGKFISQISINSRNVKIGRFKTEIEAFNAYKVAKENVLRGLAEKWESQIDPRAYNALMNYEVNIND